MFNPIIVDKFVEEGINTDLHEGIGLFTPWFSISFKLGEKAIFSWVQFKKITFSFDIAFTKEEARRLRNIKV